MKRVRRPFGYVLGWALIFLGMIMILVSVPLWVWVAMIGLLFVLAGGLLVMQRFYF